MLIRCPRCHFDREIDMSQIPPNAVMATCPRCGTRFRFRNNDGSPLDDELFPDDNGAFNGDDSPEMSPPRSRPVDRSSRRSPSDGLIPIDHDNGDGGDADDDPLPPGAVTIRNPEDTTESHITTSRTDRADGDRGEGPALSDSPTRDIDDETDESGSDTRWRGETSSGSPFGGLRGKKRHHGVSSGASPATLDIPWERNGAHNPLVALYQTIIRVMFSAPAFFAGMPAATGGLGRPLVFYLVLGVFQTLVERMWFFMRIQASAPSITDPNMQELIGSMSRSMSLPLTLVIAPVLLTLQLFFFTGVFFLMVRLVQPDRARFAVLFRVIAYSAAPTVMCVVPLVGPLVGSLWFAVSCLLGCRHALDLPWPRTLLALGPLYAIAFAIGLQVARQLLGG